MRALALVLALLLAAPAGAGQKVYEGEEAAALRCANMLAWTGVALEEAGLIGRPEMEVMLGITVLILERHVSGTWAEKKAAMEVVRQRRSFEETLEDYRRHAPGCLERFSIN